MFKKKLFIVFLAFLFVFAILLSLVQPVAAGTNEVNALVYRVTGTVGPTSGRTQLRKNPDRARPYIKGEIQNYRGTVIGGGGNRGDYGDLSVTATWQGIYTNNTPYVVFGAHEARDGSTHAAEVWYSTYFY